MAEFETSLLREKFVIHDITKAVDGVTDPLIALSNRLIVPLKSKRGTDDETFIVRCQNMHLCIRMAARILKAFQVGGALLNRPKPFDWEGTWQSVVNEYEQRYNPERWIAIYNKGRCIYENGVHHSFLDIVEQCNVHSKENYADTMPFAEKAFQQAGKNVKIDYDSNVALVIDIEKDAAKFGVIVRGPTKTTTFNFSAHKRKKLDVLNVAQCMVTASAFLEGIQLAFMVGMNNEKHRLGMIERFSEEEKMTKAASGRLSQLNSAIAHLENQYDVFYRPERPEFQQILMDAEKLAKKIIKPPPDPDEEWVD